MQEGNAVHTERMKALVTVVIPFYNRSGVIGRAIGSVLAQTFSQWELLLVDDCSTDDSPSIVNRYLSDTRIKCIRLSKNSGAAAARNAAIKASTSPFIALLDSDDVYHPEFLRLSLQAIENTDDTIGFSYTGVGNIGADHDLLQHDQRIWTIPDQFVKLRKPYLYQLQLGTAAGIVIKRSVFDKAGLFDESFRASEDTDWFIRVSEFYQGLPIHKNLIFKDNSAEDRLTTSYQKNADAYRLLIAKNMDDIKDTPFLIRRWYYKSMWLNFYNKDRGAAAKDYQEMMKYAVLNAKIRLTYIAGRLLPAPFFIRLHKRFANFNKR